MGGAGGRVGSGCDPYGMGGWLPRTARETGTLATTLY